MSGASSWSATPDPRLDPVVLEVAGSSDGAEAPAPVRVVPDGCADLLVSSPLSAPDELVELSVYGLKTRAIEVRSPTRVENVALRLHPAHLGRLFGAAASELTDRAVPLRELWGPAADALAARLARARGFEARQRILERALLREGTGEACPLAEAAVRTIDAHAGRIRVAALARALGCSERRLLRSFQRHVGMAPKAYAGIVRFRESWADLARGEPQVGVAVRRGYADQAHLLREFRRFAGTTPRGVGFVQSRTLSTR